MSNNRGPVEGSAEKNTSTMIWRKLDKQIIKSIPELIKEELSKEETENINCNSVIKYNCDQYITQKIPYDNDYYDPFTYISIKNISNPFRWIRDKRIINDIFSIVSSFLSREDNISLFYALLPKSLTDNDPYHYGKFLEEYDNKPYLEYEDDFSPLEWHQEILDKKEEEKQFKNYQQMYEHHSEVVEYRNMVTDLYHRFGPVYLQEVENVPDRIIASVILENIRI
jgi:hypothetical protein